MKKSIFIFIAIFVLLVYIFTVLLENSFSKQEESILTKEQKQIQISYNAVRNMYGIALNTIVQQQILQPKVIQILKQISNSNDEEKIVLRGKLYRKLWNLYDKELVPLNIKQLQFHTKDGKSFLRFLDPTLSGDDLQNIRKTVRNTNEKVEYSSGFEGGHTSPGFRHVYPIVSESEHLGSVELSLSFRALKKEMTKLLPYMSFSFIMKSYISTDMVTKDNIERFSKTLFSKEYVTENPDILKLDKDDKTLTTLNHISNFLSKNGTNRLLFSKHLNSKKQFYIFINLQDVIEVIHFLPIYDTNDKLAAYIIGSDQHKDLKIMHNQKNFYLIFGVIFIFLFMLLSYLHFANVKKIVLQKNEIETIAQTVKNGLIVMDKNGKVTFINDSACDILKYKKHELLHEVIHNKIHHHPSNEENCPIINVGISGNSYEGEEKFIAKGGNMFPTNVSCSPLKIANIITGTVIVFRDITKDKKNEQKIKKMAYYDFLTNLPNRKLFNDRLDITISKSKRYGHFVGLVYIDLDNFKDINDNHGHNLGDSLLKEVATRLSSLVRQEDTIARLGGDEFVIIIDKLDDTYDNSYKVFEPVVKKIYNSFSKPFIIDKHSYSCGASIGGLIFKGSDEITTSTIINKADLSMYKAKKDGKNQYKIYEINSHI